jgi:hypothetical protein
MPSGLSNLQKTILGIAARYADSKCYYAEVCCQFWGWLPVDPDANLHEPGTKKFDRTRIGHDQYNRRMATWSSPGIVGAQTRV